MTDREFILRLAPIFLLVCDVARKSMMRERSCHIGADYTIF